MKVASSQWPVRLRNDFRYALQSLQSLQDRVAEGIKESCEAPLDTLKALYILVLGHAAVTLSPASRRINSVEVQNGGINSAPETRRREAPLRW
ncbi:MAG: hypothetical protein A2W93_08590 [Bacteroidetes bacterium GWF2_43_63]|nr:MAG: hypothetical protein A2W94_14760 [Bacteroidetes bacterium GWE2_42_42]OFY55905.1 MAG: hypothetical protein A2W93_08590 [Bacteroidetes bacterium GWF2_43_63]HCB63519.1 hypothetical protein [Bacteroidales bacterium]HCY22927.1 hypothetical protein [Bacteroidales bacterium]